MTRGELPAWTEKIAPVDMNGAALTLGICRRSLQDLLKRYPFYYSNGNRKLFTEDDVKRLSAALRREAEEKRVACRSSSSRRVKARRRAGTSGEPTSDAMWIKAQALLNDGSQDRFSTGSKPR